MSFSVGFQCLNGYGGFSDVARPHGIRPGSSIILAKIGRAHVVLREKSASSVPDQPIAKPSNGRAFLPRRHATCSGPNSAPRTFLIGSSARKAHRFPSAISLEIRTTLHYGGPLPMQVKIGGDPTQSFGQSLRLRSLLAHFRTAFVGRGHWRIFCKSRCQAAVLLRRDAQQLCDISRCAACVWCKGR